MLRCARRPAVLVSVCWASCCSEFIVPDDPEAACDDESSSLRVTLLQKYLVAAETALATGSRSTNEAVSRTSNITEDMSTTFIQNVLRDYMLPAEKRSVGQTIFGTGQLVVLGALVLLFTIWLIICCRFACVRSSTQTKMADGGEDVSLDDDIYGVAIYSIIHDGYGSLSGNHDNLELPANLLRFLLIITFLCSNYVLQVSMLIFIQYYLVIPSKRASQTIYREFHKASFTKDGKFMPEAFDRFLDKDSLCELVFSRFWLMFAILALWCGLMITEWRHNERMHRDLMSLPSNTMHGGMIVKSNEAGEEVERVMHLTPLLRFLVYFLVVLPKACITIVLFLQGLVWLTATQGFANVIFSWLVLGVILSIDELIYAALVPKQIQQAKTSFKLCHPTKMALDAETISAYIRSLSYFSIMLAVPFFYLTLGQSLPWLGVYPGYVRDDIVDHCGPYYERKMRQVCIVGQICFPYAR